MIKDIQQDKIPSLSMHVSHERASKFKIENCKTQETETSTTITGESIIFLFIIDQTSRQQTSKATEYLSNTID